ncbi:hypothetical protein JCM3774_006414 [Rhodotorula dairenensis]
MATSNPTRPGTPSNLVQVHAYRRFAPAYAAAPAEATLTSPPPPAPAPAASRSATPAVRPFSSQEVRQLVLEYLTHEGYVGSAVAFAREMAVDGSAASGEAIDDDDDDDDDNAETLVSPWRRRSDTTHECNGVMEGEAMQDVKGPTESAAAADAAAGETDAVKSNADGLPAVNGTGKTVPFLRDGGDADGIDGLTVPSALSEDQVLDLRLRKNIRDAIVEGRIGQAVDLLHEHYPAVLAPSPSATPSDAAFVPKTASFVPKSASLRQPLADSSKSGPSSCTPQTFFVPPSLAARTSPVPLRPSSALSSAVPVTGAQLGPWASSLSPEIIGLNLQTQTFIELMRTAHATSAISTPSTPTSSVHGGLGGSTTTGGGGGTGAGAGAGGGGDAHSDAEMSASTSSLGGSASILNVAIAQSQALRENVLRLPVGKDREGWERECIDVCGLLAYKDLATCPVRGYLSQSRRDCLAEMVNSAILQHTGRTPHTLLSLAARQAAAMWDTLREMNHPFPPPEAVPTGRDRDSNNGKNKPPRTYPVFDLHTFLHDRESAPNSHSSDDMDS